MNTPLRLSQLLAPWLPDGQLPKAILFDLDGTLVDSVPDLTTAVDAMLTDLELPVAGEAKVRQWVGNGATQLVRHALADSMEHQACAAIDPAHLSHALERFRHHYRRCNGELSQVYPGVSEALEALHNHGCKLGVVTNKPVEFTAPLLELLGLSRWFGVQVGGDSLPQKKPDAAPLLHALACLQTHISQALMIGDSRNDILAARAAGMPVIVLSYGYNHGADIRLEGADFVVDSLAELL